MWQYLILMAHTTEVLIKPLFYTFMLVSVFSQQLGKLQHPSIHLPSFMAYPIHSCRRLEPIGWNKPWTCHQFITGLTATTMLSHRQFKLLQNPQKDPRPARNPTQDLLAARQQGSTHMPVNMVATWRCWSVNIWIHPVGSSRKKKFKWRWLNPRRHQTARWVNSILSV